MYSIIELQERLSYCPITDRWFFGKLEYHMDSTSNIAIIRSKELTPTEIGYKTKAYTSLHEMGIVKRIKREHYLISPYYIPNLKNFTEIKSMWESLP